MKQVTKIFATFFLTLLLFAQSAPFVQAKGENKKPDPNFMDKATHVEKSNLPYYGKDAIVDIYLADGMFYSVDTITQDIVEIEPDVMSYQVDSVYDENQLQGLAETIIADFLGDKVKLDKLSFSLNQKIGTYFFRWDDVTKKNDDGFAFIQVGLSQNGDFLNLVNTLPFGNKFSAGSTKALLLLNPNPSLIGPFNQIYANGGSYWTAGNGAYLLSATGGYYSLYPTGCSGTFCSKYYYSTATSSAFISGKWTPNANTNTKAAAFIPYGSNATATVKYEIKPIGSASIFKLIDQNAYGNTWVNITPVTVVTSGISYIKLFDVGFNGTGTSSYKVAWDEVWVYNP